MNVHSIVPRTALACAAGGALMLLLAPGAAIAQRASLAKPKFSEAVAFDVS